MGKKKDISPTRRARIIKMREQEKSYGDISKKLKCSKSAAKRVINYWKTTGSIIALPRPGKTTKDQ